MNLFELFVKIGVDDQASGKLSKLSSSLGKGLATAAKIGTAAVGSAAAGITALTKAAVDNYAEYEQLVGGVETLFKDSADKVQEYAANAYKTAGMSANEYMSTVTSFSASLLQSLGGDTAAAAEYANQALTDMSDNANKMGTSMEMIQNAYQGFAKQNYTMLDNLKLGYGGTKEEMARLIEDAAKLKGMFGADAAIYANQGVNGDLAIIIDAIHTVQTEMGITGTTAAEASETIAGSVASAKAAWRNLVTGIASGNADVGKLTDEFITSVETSAGNILPVVDTVIENLLGLLAEKSPDIVKGGAKLFGKIAAGAIESIPLIISSIPTIIEAIVEGFTESDLDIVEIGKDIVRGIWEGISSLAGWIGKKVTGFFNGLFDDVKENEEIHSPSKKWAFIGKNDALGFGKGWEDGLDEVENQISSSMRLNVSDIDTPGVGALSEETREYTFNFINEMDGEEFGRKIYKLFIRADKIRGESLVEVGT